MNEFTLVFSINELNVLLNALGNAPYAQAFPVIRKIEEQTQEQLSKAQESEA